MQNPYSIFLLLACVVALIPACGGGGGSGENENENETSELLVSLDVSPQALDFGAVRSGQSSALAVTIKNTGDVDVTGFSGGDPDDDRFQLTSSCGDLTPGSSCSYTFVYQPATNGIDQAISSTVTSAGSFNIDLSGSAYGSALWVTPRSIDFGDVGLGETSATHTVTITNQGNITLDAFAGGAPSDSQFGGSQNCAAGVAPGASCQYNFTFTPDTEGASITTSNSSTSAGPFAIALTGTGVGADAWVTPRVLEFGPVEQNTTSPTQVVTITNTGMATLTNFAGGAPFDNQFGASQSCAGGVLPGASCQYNLNFTPTTLGIAETTSNSSSNGGDIVIALSGEGVAVGSSISGPGLWVTPLLIDFGPVGVGDTSPTQSVIITNTGDATLSSFAGGAPFDNQFGATQNCASGVAPGASCQYNFKFSPTDAGFFETSSNSSTNGGAFSIQLQGTGVGAGLTVSPLVLDFGTVAVGATSATQVVTITNTGLATLENFAGGAPGDTQFGASQSCASGVAPGATCQYNFNFTPIAEGYFETTSNSATNAGAFSILLRGGAVN